MDRPSRGDRPSGTGDPSAFCGGCVAAAACRLGLTGWSVDTVRQSTACDGRCPADWHSGPGIAFGGWTAAVFDDVLGRTVLAFGELPRTASLHIDYRRPVPVETPLLVRTAVVGREGRRRLVRSEMSLVDREVLAVAEATMVVVEQDPDRPARRTRSAPRDFIDRHQELRSALRNSD
jgi:hypothetical protein